MILTTKMKKLLLVVAIVLTLSTYISALNITRWKTDIRVQGSSFVQFPGMYCCSAFVEETVTFRIPYPMKTLKRIVPLSIAKDVHLKTVLLDNGDSIHVSKHFVEHEGISSVQWEFKFEHELKQGSARSLVLMYEADGMVQSVQKENDEVAIAYNQVQWPLSSTMWKAEWCDQFEMQVILPWLFYDTPRILTKPSNAIKSIDELAQETRVSVTQSQRSEFHPKFKWPQKLHSCGIMTWQFGALWAIICASACFIAMFTIVGSIGVCIWVCTRHKRFGYFTISK